MISPRCRCVLFFGKSTNCTPFEFFKYFIGSLFTFFARRVSRILLLLLLPFARVLFFCFSGPECAYQDTKNKTETNFVKLCAPKSRRESETESESVNLCDVGISFK
jgi:hypothetical protein